jgi:hypothetical protein
VNGKGYGSQLHRALKSPLTPLQKALQRLEKGQVIISYFEGKTKVYQFNPAFPLLYELEQMLKKAYTLLPSPKKRELYLAKEDRKGSAFIHEKAPYILKSFWELLNKITSLTFHAKTKSKDEKGWNGRGQGEVALVKERSHILLFQEKGQWQNAQGEEVSFSNVFRWTLDQKAGVIALEHLRRGADHPVFLFHLAPTGKHALASVDSHLCEGDTYFGQIRFTDDTLHLNWRVIGPVKNEEIDYYYSL